MNWMPVKQSVQGVGLILYCETKEGVYVHKLEELKDKPEVGKMAGMSSFAMETREWFEKQLRDVLPRLIREELPGMGDVISGMPKFIGTYGINYYTWLFTFAAECRIMELPRDVQSEEVTNHRWVPLGAALEDANLRPGAFDGLDDFSKNLQDPVIRKQCRDFVHLERLRQHPTAAAY